MIRYFESSGKFIKTKNINLSKVALAYVKRQIKAYTLKSNVFFSFFKYHMPLYDIEGNISVNI